MDDNQPNLDRLTQHIELLQHSITLAVDQIHPYMDPTEELLLDANLEGMHKEVRYLQSALDEMTRDIGLTL